jgi:hypothetical protein
MGVIATLLGNRSERPYYFECDARTLTSLVPGVQSTGNGVTCGFETASVVAGLLEQQSPNIWLDQIAQPIPGLDEYKAMFGDKPRQYQRDDALWLAQRRYALLCNEMRTGKSLTCLMAATLVGAKRVLILCPSLVKWVWADEIAKWMKTPALLLEGLNCDLARAYCVQCMQRGRTEQGEWCSACRARNGSSYGYHIHEVLTTSPAVKRIASEKWHCRRHPEFVAASGQAITCEVCLGEFNQTLTNSRFVVCNYELITPRAARDERGRTSLQAHLRGWGKLLASQQWDLVILDESHYLRGFSSTYKRTDTSRYGVVKDIVKKVPIVWGVTGTPIFGFVRDLYPQLDIITGGLFGRPFQFASRYCAAYKGAYGWVLDGRSNEDELITRLSFIKTQRRTKDVVAQMPIKQRSVFHIEPERAAKHKLLAPGKGRIGELISAAAAVKRPHVAENILAELSESQKVYVLTYRPSDCTLLADYVQRKMDGKDWRTRMREVNAEAWNTAGLNVKARFDAARAFREHQGAGVFFATIESMPGGLSLRGATSVHMVDFDTSPSAMEQAESRPCEPGVRGVNIVHYIVKGSIDEDLEAIVIPKFKTKDKMLNDDNARNVLDAFSLPSESEVLSEVWARHCAHLNGDEDDDE